MTGQLRDGAVGASLGDVSVKQSIIRITVNKSI